MPVKQLTNGNPFGTHRVLEPQGVLPQPANKLDNDMSRIWDNELLVDVDTLNVDSASFTQIKEQAGGDEQKIAQIILDIVAHRGKQQNPVTGSGGMFIGRLAQIGDKLKGRDLKVGDAIVSLVSLSLTPLKIEKILEVRKNIDQVRIQGQAILFESGVYARMPDDIPPTLALAALDVAGAPAQTQRLVKKGDTVVIVGASGKSGILCSYVARRQAGPTGKVIGVGHSLRKVQQLQSLGICDEVVALDATDALDCYQKIHQLTAGRMADLIINCVNIPNTEMACILMCRDGGTIYFFSMATSFTKAALGAEGVGKDVNMIIGNGFARDHDQITLSVLRESKAIRDLYQSLYC